MNAEGVGPWSGVGEWDLLPREAIVHTPHARTIPKSLTPRRPATRSISPPFPSKLDESPFPPLSPVSPVEPFSLRFPVAQHFANLLSRDQFRDFLSKRFPSRKASFDLRLPRSAARRRQKSEYRSRVPFEKRRKHCEELRVVGVGQACKRL